MTKQISILGIVLLCAGLFVFIRSVAQGETATTATETERDEKIAELENQISDKRSLIDELNDKINSFTSKANEKDEQADEYESQVRRLENEVAALETSIQAQQQEIDVIATEIELCNEQIKEKENQITRDQKNIGELLNSLAKQRSRQFWEVLLSFKSLADYFRGQSAQIEISSSITAKVNELQTLKAQIDQKKEEAEIKQDEMIAARNQIQAQQNELESQQAEKERLASKAESEKSLYNKLANSAEEEKRTLLTELSELSQAAVILRLSTGSGPNISDGAFIWPVGGSGGVVTQNYGCVSWAVYPRLTCPAGQYFHNGIDIGAPSGTPLLAVADGEVVYSGTHKAWGKWLAIKYPQASVIGVFAHLSSISVSVGQQVSQGDVVGAVGSTGFSTGPHTHFFVGGSIEVADAGANGIGFAYTTGYSPWLWLANQ